jgi:hypothetical protein
MKQNIQDVPKRALQWYSKCYYVVSVTKTFTLKGAQSRCTAVETQEFVSSDLLKYHMTENWL